MIGIKEVNEINERCVTFLEDLAELGLSPHQEKKLDKIFSVSDTEKMVGKTRKTIAKLYSPDSPPEQVERFSPKKQQTSRRVAGFTLEQINAMRDVYGTRPGRTPQEPPLTIAIQTFKGGVGKSVSTVYLGQGLAKRGYKVLIVDCDPQGSTTSSFGYIPDLAFSEENTMIPFLNGEEDTLDYAVIDTYYPGIDLIPSCIPLYEAEFGLFNNVVSATSQAEKLDFWHEFKEGLETVSNNYDIIILDSPPALGMISINILTAADAVIVPTPPLGYDFASTSQYFKMVGKLLANIPDKQYHFFKVLGTRVEMSKKNQKAFAKRMQSILGKFMFTSFFKSATAIPNTGSVFKTIFDVTPKDKAELDLVVPKETFDMVETMIDEIEDEIQIAWGREVTPRRHLAKTTHPLETPMEAI
jgi:chromosome partitioning protein